MGMLLRVGQVARKLGLNPQTLYFYERIGLIPKPRRTEAGYRLYEKADLERLAFIGRAKALGLSLDEIKELLSLQNEQALSCQEVYTKLSRKVEEIDKSIARLQELKSELMPMIQQCQQKSSNQGKNSNCVVFQEKFSRIE
ncbi:MAG: heavy metal-responsive transcriptional regulator [Thermostichus sp. DG02_5_bins_236]